MLADFKILMVTQQKCCSNWKNKTVSKIEYINISLQRNKLCLENILLAVINSTVFFSSDFFFFSRWLMDDQKVVFLLWRKKKRVKKNALMKIFKMEKQALSWETSILISQHKTHPAMQRLTQDFSTLKHSYFIRRLTSLINLCQCRFCTKVEIINF